MPTKDKTQWEGLLSPTKKKKKTDSAPVSNIPMEQCSPEDITKQEIPIEEWIPQNINKRVCYKFTRHKDEQVCCHCNYKESDHSKLKSDQTDSANNNSNETTKLPPTDAFGEIKFVHHGGKLSKYVRMDYKTDMDIIVKLLRDKWNLRLPSLLISVTGGAKSFNMPPRLKEVFCRGLMKTTESTGAWIVTGGMHAGVMKLVGEAIRDHTIAHRNKCAVVALGIATWGCVNNKECLVHQGGGWPAEYHTIASPERQQAELDHNHSHFILVDDGTQFKYQVEIVLRANLERYIAKEHKTDEQQVNMQTVCVVLEGGPGTLKTVESAILSGTPVVIVEGSGRLADILVYAYAKYKDEEKTVDGKDGISEQRVVSNVEVWKEVQKKLKETGFKVNNLETDMKRVKECLKKRDYMTIFSLSDSNSMGDLDAAILQALLKVNGDTPIKLIKLALEFNRVDVAKSDIFTEKAIWKAGELDEVMSQAIMKDKVDFVQLFLENGVIPKDFLTKKVMLALYNKIPENCQLYKLFGKKKEEKISSEDVEKLKQDLMGDFYLQEKNSNESVRMSEDKKEAHVDQASKKPDFEEPFRELFIWSVLMNRLNMAKLFWKEGQEGIAGALLAQNIIKSLDAWTDDKEFDKELQESKLYFENLAVGVLNKCYADDENKTQRLLEQELLKFNKTTNIILAVEADNKKFMAQPACLSWFNIIWRGQMEVDNALWRICVCLFFPFLIFQLIRFKEDGKVTASKMDKIKHFYNAPVTICIVNSLSYIAFLLLFSYILLSDFNPQVEIKEIILIVWVFSLLAEEMRQVLVEKSKSFRSKFRSYFSEKWNILDLFTIAFFIVGMILRFVPNNEVTFEAARIVLALNLMSFWFRLLHILSVHQQLGPKLVMIRKMMIDLAFFLIILMVFLVAYGLAAQSILYPNTEPSIQLFLDVLKKPYWQMYGELFLDEIEGSMDCTADPILYRNGTLPRCPDNTWFVPILLAGYMLITNVLMLNLLIAMFSYTFEKVQSQKDLHWYFHRYFLIKDYRDRPPLVPPFILLAHAFHIVHYFICKCCCTCTRSRSGRFVSQNILKKEKEENRVNELILWENTNSKEYIRKRAETEKQMLDYRVKETNDRVDLIGHKVDELMERSSLQVSMHDELMDELMMSSALASSHDKLMNELKEKVNLQASVHDKLLEKVNLQASVHDELLEKVNLQKNQLESIIESLVEINNKI